MHRTSTRGQSESRDRGTKENGSAVRQRDADAVHSFQGNQAALRRIAQTPFRIQRKLSIGATNDPLEAEADEVADRVMRMPDPGLTDPGLAARMETHSGASVGVAQRKCGACEEEDKLHRKSDGAATGAITAPPIVHDVLTGSGQPLDPAARAFFEPRFGANFGDVRIHTGGKPAESARSISALAFTSANNIVFDAGRYSPATGEGRRLLAHELTHVVQQSAVAPSVQRDEAPVDVAAKATEVEHLVIPGNDEKGALEKLKPLDMAVLLKVAETLYDDQGDASDQGKVRAFELLYKDLSVPSPDPALNLNEDDRLRLKAAFDAAPTRKQRNPNPGAGDPGTTPTLSGARKMTTVPTVARPGDWGEDPAGNTWVAHTEGIRTYFGSNITSKSKMRTSTWLGNNPGNCDYVPSLTKRAIGSFLWGTGGHHFAIYLNEADASADLRESVAQSVTIGNYIRKHLGDNPGDANLGPGKYLEFMQQAVPTLTKDDPTAVWTGIDKKATDGQKPAADQQPADMKWNKLIEGFKAAEGWRPVPTLTAANVNTLSSDPKDAKLIAYYKGLLGIQATPADQPSQTPPSNNQEAHTPAGK
jgi:hypothetical protein